MSQQFKERSPDFTSFSRPTPCGYSNPGFTCRKAVPLQGSGFTGWLAGPVGTKRDPSARLLNFTPVLVLCCLAEITCLCPKYIHEEPNNVKAGPAYRGSHMKRRSE